MQSQMTTATGARHGLTRLVAVGLVGGFIAVAAGAHGAPAPTPQTGTALTALTLPQVTVTDSAGVSHTVSLGTVSASATTAGSAVARLGLTGTVVAGTSLPDWTVDNTSAVPTSDHNVPIS